MGNRFGRLRDRSGKRRHVSDVLKELLRRNDMDVEFSLRWAQSVWARVCGPQAARQSRPERLSDGKLVVGVRDTVWLQELSLRKADLLAVLRSEMPETVAPIAIKFILWTGRS